MKLSFGPTERECPQPPRRGPEARQTAVLQGAQPRQGLKTSSMRGPHPSQHLPVLGGHQVPGPGQVHGALPNVSGAPPLLKGSLPAQRAGADVPGPRESPSPRGRIRLCPLLVQMSASPIIWALDLLTLPSSENPEPHRSSLSQPAWFICSLESQAVSCI